MVDIYVDLLQFYLAALKLLESGSFFLGLQKSQFKKELADIISSLKEHTAKLTGLIAAETYNDIGHIISAQEDDFIRTILIGDLQNNASDLEKALEQRTDEGCLWSTATEGFMSWRTRPGFCVLFGDTGSGKSVTASFVAKTLSGPPIVCAFYCKDDNETNKVRNIYRSILYQVIQRIQMLKRTFLIWHADQKKMDGTSRDPTLDDFKLRNFLAEVLRHSQKQIFLILDGLDECDYDDRKHLFEFLKTFSGRSAASPQIHIFLSCRPDKEIETYVKSNLFDREILRMCTSLERDQLIAKYHIERNAMDFLRTILDFVVTQLAEMAKGSAIWLKLTIEYLRKDGFARKVTSKVEKKPDLKTLEEFIKRKIVDLPPPQQLSALYKKIFDDAAQKEPHLERKIEWTLEFLAASARPVTLDELTAGVTMMLHAERVGSDFTAYEDYLEDTDALLALISPFVHQHDSKRACTVVVRFVHQSLKDLVMDRPMSSWDETSRPGSTDRRSQLNYQMLRVCVNFLLLDRFVIVDLLPAKTKVDLEFLEGFNLDDEAECADGKSANASLSTVAQAQDVDPLYEYAASFWIEHFRTCSVEPFIEYQDLARLLAPESLTLRNWTEVLKKGRARNWNLNTERFDPLVVAACFGSHKFLGKLADSHLERLNLLEDSPTLAFRRAICAGDTGAAAILVLSSGTGPQLRQAQLVAESIDEWRKAGGLQCLVNTEWERLLKVHMDQMFVDEIAYENLLDWANHLLCAASEQGCLFAIQALFHHACTHPELEDATINRSSGNIRQSIGSAAWYGQTEVIKYLLTQNNVDISPQLHHHITEGSSNLGYNMLHCAAHSGDAEIMELLVKRLPELVNEQAKGGDTPLLVLIFSHPRAIKAARVLIELGRADFELTKDGPYYSPIRTAIRGGSVDMCRLLIEAGADVDIALKVRPETNTLDLEDEIEDMDLRHTLLKEFALRSKLPESQKYLSKLES